MDVSLPDDLTKQLQLEVADGHYPSANALIEQAVRRFLDEQRRGTDRLEALRRMGNAVDQAGFYDGVVLPDAK